MKLGQRGEKSSRGQKARDVLSPEGEIMEPNAFFDFDRDVPIWIKRKIILEPPVWQGESSQFYDRAFIRSLLGLDTSVELSEVQTDVSHLYENALLMNWSHQPVGAGENFDFQVGLEKLLDLNRANTLLPRPDGRVQILNEQARTVLDPSSLEGIEGLDLSTLVNLLYACFELFPDKRMACSRLAYEKLETILEFYKSRWSHSNDELVILFDGVSKLAVLLPQAKEKLRQFVGQFKEQWQQYAEEELDTIDQDFAGLYCFMLLAQDELGMDERGRLWAKKKSPLGKTRNLPTRSTL